MSLFEEKNIAPMLIGADGGAFDDMDYLFEIKWDGERCIAYLDPKAGTELRNKRNVKMLPKVPELSEIHKQVTKRCILDGELMVLKDGKPDFFEIQRRSLMSNRFRIELAAKQYPATFIAYDILYLDGKDVTLQPLEQRKALLQKRYGKTSGWPSPKPSKDREKHCTGSRNNSSWRALLPNGRTACISRENEPRTG